jgi:HK97 family phage major capsid protein
VKRKTLVQYRKPMNNTSHDFVAHSALRQIRHYADIALEPAPVASNPAPSFLGLSANEIREYSIGSAVKTLVANRGWGTQNSLERSCNEKLQKRLGPTKNALSFFVPAEIQNRALVVATTSAGGYLVDSVNSVGFVDLLRKRTLAYRLGAQSMPGLVGNLNIPRLASGATPAALASETSTISETDDTFGQIALTPHNFGAYTECSRQLLLQSAPAVDLVINTDLTRSAATTVDDEFFNGPGSSGHATGIFHTGGTGAISGASFDWATVLSMQDTLLNANVSGERLAWVASPDVAKLLAGRQRFTGVQTPLWEGALGDGMVGGLPAASSTVIPASTIALIDFAQTIVAEWGVLEIMADPFTKFQTGTVGIRAMFSIDVGVATLQAVQVATGVS